MRIRSTTYRYPNEQLILSGTLLLVFLVIVVSASVTMCASVLFIALAVILAYSSSRSHHIALLRSAHQVTPQSSGKLYELVDRCTNRVGVELVQFFVTPSRELNAYTFGLSDPRVVVLYSALLDIMDADELSFIIGHELGHIRLGHTWLNSLVGGLAGIPGSSTASAFLMLSFLSWNRACEYSADRAGLLVCGRLDKAVSALIKLAAGPHALSKEGMAQAYQQIDAQDDTWMGNLNEAFASHPLLIRRINQLRTYAVSSEYRNLV